MSESISHVALEGFSWYAHEGFRPEQMAESIEVAESIAQQLEASGFSVTRQILIDDTKLTHEAGLGQLNPDGVEQTIGEQIKAAIEVAGNDRYPLDQINVLRESSFLEAAKEATQTIRDKANEIEIYERQGAKAAGWTQPKKTVTRVSDEKRKILIGFGQTRKEIKVMGKDGYLEIPDCDVLDYAMYQAKLKDHDMAITVLPDYMRPQQERVRAIFDFMTKPYGPRQDNPAIIVVYFNRHGEMSHIDAWTERLTKKPTEILTNYLYQSFKEK